MLKMVGFAGYARSGKSFMGNLVCEIYGLWPWAFAFPLKQRVYGMSEEWGLDTVFGNGSKPPALRDLLQQEGTERGRHFRPDIWVRHTEAFVHWVETELGPVCPGLVLTDVRFPNEQEFIHSRGGKVIRVDNFDLDMDEPMYLHESERKVSLLKVDGTIDNTGHPAPEQLIEQLIKLLGNP